MPVYAVPDLVPALPELFLIGTSLALLLYGAWRGDGATRFMSWVSVGVLIGTLILVLLGPSGRSVTFHGLFVSDGFAVFMKALVLVGSAVSVTLPSSSLGARRSVYERRSDRRHRFGRSAVGLADRRGAPGARPGHASNTNEGGRAYEPTPPRRLGDGPRGTRVDRVSERDGGPTGRAAQLDAASPPWMACSAGVTTRSRRRRSNR